MDKSTSKSNANGCRDSNSLICIYFCRKLLSEGFISSESLLPENNIENDRRPDTPLSVDSPLEMNGMMTPDVEPNSLQRLFNQHSDALTLRLENSMIVPKTWNCGIYSPIEIYIDSPSGIDQSGQASTVLSSISASDDLPTENDLFEMDVLERINRLRRQGKWSLTRLPLCLDAPRPKTHMDYFLEECMMMQIDFARERKTKQMAAKILAYEAKQYVQQRNSIGIIDLRSTPNQIVKRSSRKKHPTSLTEIISNLPTDYVEDLRSRVVISNLFDGLGGLAENRWEVIEKICDRIASTRPDNLTDTESSVSSMAFAGVLRPYQRVGVRWLLGAYENSFGCILGDESKLGKKVQVMAFLAYLEEHRRTSGPHLIVTDDVSSWRFALECFLPHTVVMEFGKEENSLCSHNICLVDRETFFSDTFVNSFFQVQIIDNAEQLMHDKSLEYIFERGYNDCRCCVLLGSPGFLERMSSDQKTTMVMLLQLILPRAFRRLFDEAPIEEEIEGLSSKRLIAFLQSFQLTRTKSQVRSQIPTPDLEVFKCRMTSKQQLLYDKLTLRLRQELTSDNPTAAMNVLRLCCSHPFLVEDHVQREASPINCSLAYPILRQCFLDWEKTEFCEQIRFSEPFTAEVERLQRRDLAIASRSTKSLHCSPETLPIYRYPVLASSPFQFVGRNNCSLSTLWQRNRFKQLARDLFSQRSSQEDSIISNACIRLLDRDLLLRHSGKLQELFKRLAEVRRQEQRCIIFTAYQSTQDLLCEALSHYNFTYLILSDEVDRKEFVETFNKNQRIACVLVSTKTSLYRLNLNNIGAVFVLETDWDMRCNDDIKHYFSGFVQSSGAKFYNFITGSSLELRTNVFDAESSLLDIGRSITAAAGSEPDKDHIQQAEDITNTSLYAPISHDMDGIESGSDTLSSSGYESSLDSAAHTEPFVYDRSFLESDSYLASVFGLQWRHRPNNDTYGLVEEAQMFDSFSNPWYTGDIIEPDEIEYTKMSPSEQQLDEDTLFDFGDDRENLYMDSGAASPKSTDGLIDLCSDPASLDASRMSIEFSLDPAIQLQTQRPSKDEHELRMAMRKSTQRIQSRTDELRRKLLETQSIVLPDPDPLFRPDGKPGYTPQKKDTEWVDADGPSWTYIEDHALLALTVKQLCAVPIPNYISRSFCINWEIISYELDKSSFHKRSPNQCCTRFRELISKKFAAVENPFAFVEQFDGIDLSLVKDEKVSSSPQQTTKFFNRSVAVLARKLEDLKRIRNVWQARSNWLNSCDDDEHFDILNRLGVQPPSPAFDTARVKRIMEGQHKLPSEILIPNKKGLSLDIVMVYHQYSRGLRLSRVITAAKALMIKAMKKPAEYQQITAYSKSITAFDHKMFVKDQGTWKLQAFDNASSLNQYLPKAPKVWRPIESRLFWTDSQAMARLNNNLEARIFHLLQFNFMQFTVDIRSNMLSSKKPISEIIQITSKFVVPRMPKRPKRLCKPKNQQSAELDGNLLEDILRTMKISDQVTNTHRILKNGLSLMPIQLEYLNQNEDFFYAPVLPSVSLPSPWKLDFESFEALSLMSAHKDSIEDVGENELNSITELFEDLLIEAQDKFAVHPMLSIQEDEDRRLFSTSKKVDVILKIRKCPRQRASTITNRHFITCVPGDHFELHKIAFDTETQQFIVNDPHTQSVLDSSAEINRRFDDKMEMLVSKIGSCSIKNSLTSSVLSTRQNQPSVSIQRDPDEVILNPTVCTLKSAQIQGHRIQRYVNGNRSSSNFAGLITKHNNLRNQYPEYVYTVRPDISTSRPRRSRGRIQVEDAKLNPSSIKFVDDQPEKSSEMHLLIKGGQPAQETVEVEVEIEVDDAVKGASEGIICIDGPKERSDEETILIDEVFRMLLDDEESISIDILMAINMLYKLSQPTISTKKYPVSSNNFRLPLLSDGELRTIEKLIYKRFNSTNASVGGGNKHIRLNKSSKNPLTKLINEQYETVSSELQRLNSKIDSKDKGPILSTMALKLQLHNETPHLSQMLQNISSRFGAIYTKKNRLLRLRCPPVQRELVEVQHLNGTKSVLNLEYKQSDEKASSKASKSSSPIQHSAVLKNSLLRTELISGFMKMSESERQKWIDTIRLRFLRLKCAQQKRRTLELVEKMGRITEEVLKENGEELRDNSLESKKKAICRLLANPSTKYPTSLRPLKSGGSSSENKPESSLQLADLLVESIAKVRPTLSNKLHPMFTKVDPKTRETWKDREEVLEVNYKGTNKKLVVFDGSLEDFPSKLNYDLPAPNVKPIESKEDIYDQLLRYPHFGPSKIIKYRAPVEVNTPRKLAIEKASQYVSSDNQTSTPATSATSAYLNPEQEANIPKDGSSEQQTLRGRQMVSIQIPSAMQVPAACTKTDQQAATANSQNIKASQPVEPVYYTKRNSSPYTAVSGSAGSHQRSSQPQTPEYGRSPTFALGQSKKDVPVFPKTASNRSMIRHVVVGNRPKLPGENEDREESSYESRLYQTAPGHRELTVREKLQQDMARGVVQTTHQKKLYPARMSATTMKRKASENQQDNYAGLDSDSTAPKRSRPNQYAYQVKDTVPPTITSAKITNVVSGVSSVGNVSNEPIKTYIRRDDHQFAIHTPSDCQSSPPTKRTPSTTYASSSVSSVQSKPGIGTETSSKST